MSMVPKHRFSKLLQEPSTTRFQVTANFLLSKYIFVCLNIEVRSRHHISVNSSNGKEFLNVQTFFQMQN